MHSGAIPSEGGTWAVDTWAPACWFIGGSLQEPGVEGGGKALQRWGWLDGAWCVCGKGCDVILSPPPVSKPTAQLSAAARLCHQETVHLNAAPGLQDPHQNHYPCEVANATCCPAGGVYFSVEVLH